MGKNSISIPSNVEVVEPMSYFKIIDVMRSCKGIITDSGGILKTSAFFGKKCILPSEQWEWSEIFDKGYATNILDRHWFVDYKMDRNMGLYYVENSCEIIINKILEKE
jgi:UDP-N-acetylglucosamine 2-epimerase